MKILLFAQSKHSKDGIDHWMLFVQELPSRLQYNPQDKLVYIKDNKSN